MFAAVMDAAFDLCEVRAWVRKVQLLCNVYFTSGVFFSLMLWRDLSGGCHGEDGGGWELLAWMLLVASCQLWSAMRREISGRGGEEMK